MIEKLEGKVANFHSVTVRCVHIELEGVPRVIELTTETAWVINRGDMVSVAGEADEKTGKFLAYAYRNHTRRVFGKFNAQPLAGIIFFVLGLAMSWAVFPLIFVWQGIKVFRQYVKVNRAAALL